MLDRRNFMKSCSGMGLAGTLFPGVLWAQAQTQGAKKITREMIENAAAIADVPISDDYKEMMLENLNDQAKGYGEIQALHIPNSVEPALLFDPVLPGMKFETERKPLRMSAAPKELVGASASRTIEHLGFSSVRELAELVRTKKVSSVMLTEMYLERLKKYDPTLKFVVTLTEERARAQAKKADAEIAAGKYRGPLHGLPWGAKDLLATKGYRTTWGAGGFETQMIEEDATVVKRLDEAGAVLVAKLTLGALALGDVWFGGVTRNPWKSGVERILGRSGIRNSGGMRGLQHWLGNARLDFFAFDALRLHRAASHVRIGAAYRRDGAFLEHGQARAHLPRGGRLRLGPRCDLRA